MIIRWLVLVSILTLGTAVRVRADGKQSAPVLALTEADAGKNIMANAEKVIEIRLRNDRDGGGWEPGSTEITGQSVARVNPLRRGNCDEFVPDKSANTNSTVGTYVYRYVCADPGTSTIRLTHLYPGGPLPKRRAATQFIGEFVVTIEVRDNAAGGESP